jgi:pyrimidine-nucleoside phosphorylase
VDAPRLIRRKRDGEELSSAEIDAFVGGLMTGDVDPEQAAALLMAGVIRGFTPDEAVALTAALVASGRTLDLTSMSRPTVDKHSTGGVADTTTLVVAPVLAACGVAVVKLSGRSLGHTGGTIDKLEAIPGMRLNLAPDALIAQADAVGVAVGSATAEIAPADAVLYALRDATATIDDVALVAASVMSKKIAGGAQSIVLDIKTGGGAFFTDVDEARSLAALCTRIGEAHQRRVTAVVSDMSRPLGRAVGNALEVAAAVDVLRGEAGGQLRELSCVLAVEALCLTGSERDEARRRVDDAISTGEALESLRRWISAQGGDPRLADDPWDVLTRAPVVSEVTAASSGFVNAMSCREIGEVAGGLGAGRRRRGDVIDPRVGIELLVTVGDEVTSGERVAWVHAANAPDADSAVSALRGMIDVGEERVEPPPLVLGVSSSADGARRSRT